MYLISPNRTLKRVRAVSLMSRVRFSIIQNNSFLKNKEKTHVVL